MPPILILVRHAQAEHNVAQDYSKHDPSITELGHQQCAKLRETLMADTLAQQAELVITSSMRRTIQTTLSAVDWLVEKGVKVVADADWQENSAKPCDQGSKISKLVAEFPGIDYSALDPVWPDKTSPAGSRYHFTRTAILARAQFALQKLYRRPEKVIIVVSHSGFLRVGVTGCWFFNADYRVFDFRAMESPESPYQLRERAYTAQKGGGLGHSRMEQVLLGSELPEELPESD
ncbi:phosphoglycerate mutase-like protein [Xylaria nigripes]|nr:phosphoglycerate mutase-like protein [Xylaria nigripes]